MIYTKKQYLEKIRAQSGVSLSGDLMAEMLLSFESVIQNDRDIASVKKAITAIVNDSGYLGVNIYTLKNRIHRNKYYKRLAVHGVDVVPLVLDIMQQEGSVSIKNKKVFLGKGN